MIGAVPASLRLPGDAAHGNLVTMMLVNLATHIADPKERLAAIVASSAKAKAITGGVKSVIPTDMPSLGIPWLMSVIAPLYRMAVQSERIPVVANLVISNVPGPQLPMYMAGAAMVAYFPVSIVIHGLALNITILSYNGTMGYGLIACKNTVTRLREFARHLRAAHRELLALVKADQAKPASARVASRAAPKRAGAKGLARTVAQGASASKDQVKAGARSMAKKAPAAQGLARKKRA
jgi:hypothetical protein